MTNIEAINKVLSIAENEIGYLEKKTISQLDSKTANAGSANYTKYWRDIKPSYQGQPWCACFVTWCIEQSFGKDNAKKLLKHYPYVYCPTMAELFKLNSNPKRGDIVIFYRNGTFVHTGFVTGVNGDKFTTIEGNTSNGSEIIPNGGGVYRKSYYNSKLTATRFVTLDWSIVSDNTPNSIVKNITIEPYDAYGIVNASSLNVRSLPSTAGEVIGQFANGDKVRIRGSVNGWFLVDIFNNGTGYIMGSYIADISIPNYLDVAEILYALKTYGIVSDIDGMKNEINNNPNGRLYWLASKLCNALHRLGGKAKSVNVSEYTDVQAIVYDLAIRGLITNTDENKSNVINEMNMNLNGRLYWLARKGLTYLRERD